MTVYMNTAATAFHLQFSSFEPYSAILNFNNPKYSRICICILCYLNQLRFVLYKRQKPRTLTNILHRLNKLNTQCINLLESFKYIAKITFRKNFQAKKNSMSPFFCIRIRSTRTQVTSGIWFSTNYFILIKTRKYWPHFLWIIPANRGYWRRRRYFQFQLI